MKQYRVKKLQLYLLNNIKKVLQNRHTFQSHTKVLNKQKKLLGFGKIS